MSDGYTELMERSGAASASTLAGAGPEAVLGRIRTGRRRRAAARIAAGAAVVALAFVGGAMWFLDRAPQEPALPPVAPEIPLELQLRQALIDGDHAMLKSLIGAGAYLDQVYAVNVNPAAMAMRSCDLEALRILEANGASRTTYPGSTFDAALIAAAASCDAETVRAVEVDTIEQPDSLGPVVSAAAAGNVEALDALAELGYPIQQARAFYGENALLEAATNEHRDAVVRLLELGADPDMPMFHGANQSPSEPTVLELLSGFGNDNPLIRVLEDASDGVWP